MPDTARDEILKKLKAAPKSEVPPRPDLPPMDELSWDRDQMIEKFAENLTALTGVFHRVGDWNEVLDKLTEIAVSEDLKAVMASNDDVITRLELPEWGKKNNVRVLTAEDSEGREAFKGAVFTKVDAGITGVDYAVAESATLCLVHDKDQPRLVSLAPVTHIAIVPADRLYPVYESVIGKVFKDKNVLPSQATFITGPSMTGDIQGVPFKGMHGPKKLFVVLVG